MRLAFCALALFGTNAGATPSPQMEMWTIDRIEKHLYQDSAVPDSVFDALSNTPGTSVERMLFLRGYSAALNGDSIRVQSIIEQYRERYNDDSYSAVLESLSEYLASGNLSQALLLRALTSDYARDNEFLHYQLYLATYRSHESKAIGHLDHALRIQPQYDMAAKYRAYYFELPEECSKVINLLQPVQTGSRDYDLHVYLGDAYRLCEDLTSAKTCYEAASRIRPTFEAYESLGDMRLATGEPSSTTAEAYLHALAIKEDGRLRTRLGWLYFSYGQIADAKAAFVYAAELNPCDTQPVLGLMYLGEWKMAKDYFLKGQNCGSSDFTRSAYGIVLNCHELGSDSPQCAELIDEFLQVFGYDPDAVTHMHTLIKEFNLHRRDSPRKNK